MKNYMNIFWAMGFHIKLGSKSVRIRFDKIDGIMRIYHGTRYLKLFGTKRYDAIYDRIR